MNNLFAGKNLATDLPQSLDLARFSSQKVQDKESQL